MIKLAFDRDLKLAKFKAFLLYQLGNLLTWKALRMRLYIFTRRAQ